MNWHGDLGESKLARRTVNNQGVHKASYLLHGVSTGHSFERASIAWRTQLDGSRPLRTWGKRIKSMLRSQMKCPEALQRGVLCLGDPAHNWWAVAINRHIRQWPFSEGVSINTATNTSSHHGFDTDLHYLYLLIHLWEQIGVIVTVPGDLWELWELMKLAAAGLLTLAQAKRLTEPT